MMLLDYLVDYALQINSDCLRIVLSRETHSTNTDTQQFSSDALHRIDENLGRLKALWHLVKPAVTKARYQCAMDRLDSLSQMLAVELDRASVLGLIDKLKARTDKKKALALLEATETEISVERSVRRHDIQAISLVLQEESRDWRELQPAEKIDDDRLLARYAIYYRKSQRKGSAVMHGRADDWGANWPKTVSGTWFQLSLIKPSLTEANSARQWYLGRLVQSLERTRTLNLLESYLSRGGVKVPGKLARLMQARWDKLHSRQMKLYDCIFGQKPEEYAASVSEGVHNLQSLEQALESYSG